MLKGGDTGPAVVVGNPEKSLLITAVGYKNPDLQMPPDNKKLPDEAIADLTTWVKNGAVWPGAGSAGRGGLRPRRPQKGGTGPGSPSPRTNRRRCKTPPG